MVEEIIIEFSHRFTALLTTPSQRPEMLWIVFPLLIIIVMMTFYFSKYKEEELGWNTALGNSLILVFVSVDLLRTISNTTASGALENLLANMGATIIALLLFMEGLLLLFVNFYHVLPKKIAFVLSSPLSVNLLAYVTIAIIYSRLPIDLFTISAAIFFFALALVLFTAFGMMAQRWWLRVEQLKAQEVIEDVKKEKKVLQKTKRVLKEREKKIQEFEKRGRHEVKKKQSELKKIRRTIHPQRKR